MSICFNIWESLERFEISVWKIGQLSLTSCVHWVVLITSQEYIWKSKFKAWHLLIDQVMKLISKELKGSLQISHLWTTHEGRLGVLITQPTCVIPHQDEQESEGQLVTQNRFAQFLNEYTTFPQWQCKASRWDAIPLCTSSVNQHPSEHHEVAFVAKQETKFQQVPSIDVLVGADSLGPFCTWRKPCLIALPHAGFAGLALLPSTNFQKHSYLASLHIMSTFCDTFSITLAL